MNAVPRADVARPPVPEGCLRATAARSERQRRASRRSGWCRRAGPSGRADPRSGSPRGPGRGGDDLPRPQIPVPDPFPVITGSPVSSRFAFLLVRVPPLGPLPFELALRLRGAGLAVFSSTADAGLPTSGAPTGPASEVLPGVPPAACLLGRADHAEGLSRGALLLAVSHRRRPSTHPRTPPGRRDVPRSRPCGG